MWAALPRRAWRRPGGLPSRGQIGQRRERGIPAHGMHYMSRDAVTGAVRIVHAIANQPLVVRGVDHEKRRVLPGQNGGLYDSPELAGEPSVDEGPGQLSEHLVFMLIHCLSMTNPTIKSRGLQPGGRLPSVSRQPLAPQTQGVEIDNHRRVITPPFLVRRRSIHLSRHRQPSQRLTGDRIIDSPARTRVQRTVLNYRYDHT
jgi:hypothetical protein